MEHTHYNPILTGDEEVMTNTVNTYSSYALDAGSATPSASQHSEPTSNVETELILEIDNSKPLAQEEQLAVAAPTSTLVSSIEGESHQKNLRPKALPPLKPMGSSTSFRKAEEISISGSDPTLQQNQR